MSKPHLPASREEKQKWIGETNDFRTLASGVPNSFRFHKSELGTRLYFIGCPENEYKNSLFYVNIDEGNSDRVLDWNPVLSASNMESKPLSKEEELLRERKRLVSFGITSFNFSETVQKFLVPAGGSLYTIDVSQQPPVSSEISAHASGARMDAKWSPDAKFISFTRNNDLWISNAIIGNETRLTQSNSDTITNGIAEFVMQEEFDRFTGYWWAPKVPENSSKISYRILYFQVDESQVKLYRISEQDIEGTTEDQRYPLTGADNAFSKVCLVELDADGKPISTKSLVPSIQSRFPWCEYILRAGWLPDGSKIWLQLLDRVQQKFAFVTFPLSAFSENTNVDHETIREENTPIWFNVSNLLYFSENCDWILFTSEETGYRHIYHYSFISKKTNQITSGDWIVDEDFMEVDVDRKLVYFTGTKDTPLEQHLYVTNYENPGEIFRLTEPGFFHKNSVYIGKDKTLFADKYSSVSSRNAVAVYSVTFENNKPVVNKLLNIKVRSSAIRRTLSTVPEFFSFKNSLGLTIHGVIYKPLNCDPSKKYPTLLYIYGGPHVQLVANEYDRMIPRNTKFQLYAQLGIASVIIDGVGSARRGLQFEGHLKNSMGTVELRDQIEGLRYLNENSIVDIKRVCITGWSYGGYMSLMALAQYPDVFKLAISGAPVVMWEGYDTGYTERYMSLPSLNEVGYKKGSVTHYINGFPNEEKRLLVIHGLKDENVHFSQTAKLIEALVDAGKPYELYVYPKERHGVRSYNASVHLDVKVLSFLENL